MLTAVNVALGGLVMGELLVLGWLIMRPIPAVTIPPAHAPSTPASQSPPELPPIAIAPIAAMPSLASAAVRPVFRLDGSRSLSSVPHPSDHATALAARLSVAGIVTGHSAQAVIADSQTNKTYVVTIGQGVVEGLVVEDIQQDRVVLTLDGERIELSR